MRSNPSSIVYMVPSAFALRESQPYLQYLASMGLAGRRWSMVRLRRSGPRRPGERVSDGAPGGARGWLLGWLLVSFRPRFFVRRSDGGSDRRHNGKAAGEWKTDDGIFLRWTARDKSRAADLQHSTCINPVCESFMENLGIIVYSLVQSIDI
ncbi:hypothetical protein M8818_002107 [Zalaria obscura]|uniref:Uncharacterized protein n=1 Tax=Zalaria obscura TaxID=2024903 RepID=A0ACC3SHW8_9PEZI